jgi:regulator of sigma E protease
MLTTAITFFIILAVLILVHELGHFTAARIFKVRAEEFGFGLPPRIFGFVKVNGKWKYLGRKEDSENYDNTVWSINWLPLGGFVKIKGEDENALNEEGSLASRPPWQRFIIMFAGVFMNFILSFVILSIAFMAGIPSLVDDDPDPDLNAKNEQIQIMSISPDSPIDKAEIKVGDVILSINNEKIGSVSQVQDITSVSKDIPLEFVFRRGSEEIAKTITPLSGSELQKGEIGVGLVKTATVKYPWYEAIYKGAETTVSLTFEILKAFGKIIGDLFTGQKVGVEVAGPVGIAVLTGQVITLGFIYVLQFAALLSINLAIINLLPIPALDGGRLLFIIIEKIKGSPVKQATEARFHQVGFILLMILMALIVFRDIKIHLF